jgi:outer membrane lipoprotein-sorting protein
MKRCAPPNVWSHGCRVLALAVASTVLAAPAAGATLESVLRKMDETAEQFRTAQASFAWTVYNQVINDVAEKESGKIYFRRTARDIQMVADIAQPDSRQIVFSQGKIQVYQPKTETVDVYDAGAHREEFETFLVLGFGSSGDSIKKSFTVKDAGEETVDGIRATKLELAPISEKIRQQFPQIILWIDSERGVSIEQKLVEANGDYRLAKYSDIRLNQKLSDRVFRLKTTGRTKIVSH